MNKTTTSDVVYFKRRQGLFPTINEASFIDIIIFRIKELLGKLLISMKVPGAVRDIQINDDLTAQKIDIHVGVLFTRISVNGRDYFFHRVSGKFDGKGWAVTNQTFYCKPA